MLAKNILVPIDFSDYSKTALEYAVELAAKLDAKLHVVNAIPVPVMGISELGVSISATMIANLVTDHQNALERLVETHRNRAPIASINIRSGDPRDTILQVCEEVGADLIVMGTHGRRGVSRAILGSVTESIVRTARCPVLTIHQLAAGT